MDKYSKYTPSNNGADNQQVVSPNNTSHANINEITELSTPKEMANFVTKKLVAFIEQELTDAKKITS